MTEQVAVITPESVDFSLDTAGLGSRFLALLIDTLVKTVGAGLVGAGAFFLGRAAGEGTMAGQVIIAVGAAIAVAIYGLYHIVLEAAWSGRTIGKRALGLRVVKDSGVPIGFWDALLRNLLRLVDVLPSFYLAGIVTMFATPQHKRVGDLAAATLVIKERALLAPTVAAAPGSPAGRPLDLPRLGYQEAELIRNFLDRRSSLAPQARQQLAEKLAEGLGRAGVTPVALGLAETATAEDLLEAWQALEGN